MILVIFLHFFLLRRQENAQLHCKNKMILSVGFMKTAVGLRQPVEGLPKNFSSRFEAWVEEVDGSSKKCRGGILWHKIINWSDVATVVI